MQPVMVFLHHLHIHHWLPFVDTHLCRRACARLAVIAPQGQRGASERGLPVPGLASLPSATAHSRSFALVSSWPQSSQAGLGIGKNILRVRERIGSLTVCPKCHPQFVGSLKGRVRGTG